VIFCIKGNLSPNRKKITDVEKGKKEKETNLIAWKWKNGVSLPRGVFPSRQ